MKPLLGRKRLNLHECLAKVVLENLFPDRFNDIQILDKPDLQEINHNIGIEVTRAVDQTEEEILGLYAGIIHNQVRDKDSAIEAINKHSRSIRVNGKTIKQHLFSDGRLSVLPGKDNFDLIIKEYQRKIDKLNNNYKIFDSNYLFVYSDILADDSMIRTAMESMKDISHNKKLYKYKFDIVYIFVTEHMYILDLLHDKYEIVDVDFQYEWKCMAREMVKREDKEY